MSAPKKPGTDLAALKARLAKKTQGQEPPAPAAPAAHIPAPGEVRSEPEPPPPAHVPAPGQVARPQVHADIPAPGEVSRPVHEPLDAGDEPFAGGGAFDPTDGLIDAGPEIKTRSNKGLILLAAVAAMGFGVAVGFLLQKITSTSEMVAIGKKKGAHMVEEVKAVSDTRKTISLAMEDLKKAIAQDPKKGAEQLTSLLTENFDKSPKVDELFGWQLAAVHPTGVKKTFDLYGEANALKLDLGYLAGFLNQYADALKEGSAPHMFAVMSTGSSAKLVEAIQPICDIEAKTPCEDKEAGKAVGYLVRDQVGAEPVVVPRGFEEGQAVLLLPDGAIYNYAIGLEPNKNAVKVYASLLGKVEARLEAMNKAENIALAALKSYADNPTVDDTTSQPEPAAAE